MVIRCPVCGGARDHGHFSRGMSTAEAPRELAALRSAILEAAVRVAYELGGQEALLRAVTECPPLADHL